MRAQHERFYVIVDEFPPLRHLSPTLPGWLQRFLAQHGTVEVVFDPRASGVPEESGSPKDAARESWDGVIYDWADAFYVPLSGFERMSNPGPMLKIYSIAGESKAR